MREVRLGSKVYFVREESDPREEIVLLAFMEDSDSMVTIPDPTDVWVQNETGKLVEVRDEFTIRMVKAAAQASSSHAASQPDWKRKLKALLDREHATGKVSLITSETGGKYWVIPRTKKSVFDELSLEITLETFRRQVQSDAFKYQGFPLKWADRGGSP